MNKALYNQFIVLLTSRLLQTNTEGVGSRFRWYRGRRVPFSCFAPGLIFGGTEGNVSRFHVLHSRTRFRRYGGRQVPFSCFAHPDSFSATPRALGPVFIFCAPGHVFGDTEAVGSSFHVLHVRTYFRRNRGRRLPFSCFAFPYSFLVVSRASDHVFMF
jgi:hypothetical protein